MMGFLGRSVLQSYAFCRNDLSKKPIIEADVNYVVSNKRGTTLEKDGVTI